MSDKEGKVVKKAEKGLWWDFQENAQMDGGPQPENFINSFPTAVFLLINLTK